LNSSGSRWATGTEEIVHLLSTPGRMEVVVNANGDDTCQPLLEHTLDDFCHTLDVNLLGARLLTQTLLSVIGGVTVHLAGFAGCRLAQG
jgi:NAD(P)-dependent dehydrogenase (short-subunit alcohol dehydrogenase family)